MPTEEQIQEQIKRDKEEISKLSPTEQARLKRQVEIIRRPSHTNFSDPEAL
jgi:hypothetical protein